jgi:hypothetical protein
MWHIIWNTVAVCSLILNALIFIGFMLKSGTEADIATEYCMFKNEIDIFKGQMEKGVDKRVLEKILAEYDKIDSEG